MNENGKTNRFFRLGCLLVGLIYVVLAGSILGRDISASMGPFGVPENTLSSPHYADAITWVYVHMMVLGMVIATVGWFGQSLRLQRAFSLLMVLVHCLYLYLDLRTSDTALGNGLYEGPESAIPAIIVFAVLIVFAIACWTTFRTSAGRS